MIIHSIWRSWFVFFNPSSCHEVGVLGFTIPTNFSPSHRGASWKRLVTYVWNNPLFLQPPNEPLILPSMQRTIKIMTLKWHVTLFINEQCDLCNIIFLFYISLMSMLSRQIPYECDMLKTIILATTNSVKIQQESRSYDMSKVFYLC